MSCENCSGPGTLTCLACKSVRYCSRECQRVDWKKHKAACLSMKAKKLPSESDATMLRESRRDEAPPSVSTTSPFEDLFLLGAG